MAALRKLKIAIKTGSEAYSGTDASIYVVLCTRGGGGRTYRLPTRKEHLEAGKLDIYRVELEDGPELADLHSMLVVNGMTGTNPGWKLLWIKVEAVDVAGYSWKLADVILERWLDVRAGRSPVAFVPLKQPLEALGGEDAAGVTEATLVNLA